MTNPDLQNLLDRRAIDDLSARFSDAANRNDADAFSDLWAENALWMIGAPMNLKFEVREQIVASFSDLISERWEYFIQLPTASHVVEIDGDIAVGRQYVIELAQANSGAGNFNVSFYEDRLARHEGKWLFVERSYKTLYKDDSPLKGRIPVAEP